MRLRIILHHLAALLLLLNLWGCSDNVFTVLHGAWSSSERRMMETGNADSAAVLLLRAKENGKVIESITQTGGNRSGWEIRFTDGTACRLIHAVFEDVTKDIQRFINSPSSYLYVDQDTMWCHIDPSTGMLARLSGAGECPATPASGLHRMKSGAGAGLPAALHEQYNYTSGEETEDGYVFECCRVGGKDRCVRLVNSLFLHGLDCGRRAERVITTNLYWEWSHVRDYHLVATAIVENTLTGKATVWLENGEEITFDMKHRKAAAMAVDTLTVASPTFIERDSLAVIPFEVTPADAVFSHQAEAAAAFASPVDVRLLMTDSCGLHPATHVRLARISHQLLSGGGDDTDLPMSRGRYLATIQDAGTGEAFTEQYVLQLTVRDDVGAQESTLTSAPFTVCSKKGGPAVPRSKLPIVCIDTPGETSISSKTVWVKDATLRICRPDGSVQYEGTTSIRGRGNSSWSPPKKPYNLKLDAKAPLLGMPADTRWCLLAGWYDRTLIRDAVARRISEVVGMEWTPRGEFVELVLNGTYVGSYYLCEKIKVGSHRVDIQKMSRSDNSGDALTGGYLAEVDTYYDEPVKFRSAVRGFPYMMHSPDSEDITAEQVAYFQGYIGELEASLYDDERFARGEHRAYIDFDSFIRYWLVMELTYNSEISMPKSVWLYKDRQERLKLGPVWDFDYGTFRHVPRFCTAGTLYYNRLFSDDAFVERLSALWAAVRPELDRVAAYIDQLTDKMEVSAVANDALWAYAYGEFPVDDAGLSFREAAYALKQAYVERLQWLDEKITQRSFVAD